MRTASWLGVSLLLVCFAGCCLCTTTPQPPPQPKLADVIHVSMRQSALDSATGVLQIENESNQKLSLLLLVRNNDTKQEVKFPFLLEPNAEVELGTLEIDWKFIPNEFVGLADLDSVYVPLKMTTFRTEDGLIGIRENLW